MHPWRRLRELAHVTLLWHDGGPKGVTNFAAQTISLRRGMTQAERRSTVLHECLHIERGPALTTLAAREELRVEKETARLLLPDMHRVADDLWVDEQLLRCRLRHLHPSERGYLQQRLAEDGH